MEEVSKYTILTLISDVQDCGTSMSISLSMLPALKFMYALGLNALTFQILRSYDDQLILESFMYLRPPGTAGWIFTIRLPRPSAFKMVHRVQIRT